MRTIKKEPTIVNNIKKVSGVGFGSVLACVISWSINKSVLWAILHGFFSWFYIIYFLIQRNAGNV